MDNRAKQKLRSGRPVLANSVNFVHAGLAEYLGHLGYDVLTVDGEHGILMDADVEGFIRACDLTGATAMLRLPPNRVLMERYAGMGMRAYLVPRVNSAAGIREVLDAVMFPPVGERGIGNFRAARFRNPAGGWDQFMAQANANTIIMVVVEDREGLAALGDLVKVPEIDVIIIGTSDLSASLGVPGQRDHPRVVEALNQAADAITEGGKVLGWRTTQPAEIRPAYDRGARYFTTSFSNTFLVGASGFLEAINELQ